MVRMKRDGVWEEELLEIAAQINFEVKNDDDLLRLFREAVKLGFWPDLNMPKYNPTGFNVPITGELRPLRAFGKMKNSSLYDIEPTNNPRKVEKEQKERLVLELERLTKLANALDNKNKGEDLDEWLKNI